VLTIIGGAGLVSGNAFSLLLSIGESGMAITRRAELRASNQPERLRDAFFQLSWA